MCVVHTRVLPTANQAPPHLSRHSRCALCRSVARQRAAAAAPGATARSPSFMAAVWWCGKRTTRSACNIQTSYYFVPFLSAPMLHAQAIATETAVLAAVLQLGPWAARATLPSHPNALVSSALPGAAPTRAPATFSSTRPPPAPTCTPRPPPAPLLPSAPSSPPPASCPAAPGPHAPAARWPAARRGA